MRGFSVSQNQNLPRHRIQKVWSLRDDFSTSYPGRGRSRPQSRRRVSTTR